MLSLSFLILAVVCYLAVALAVILYEYNHAGGLDALPRSRRLALAASLLVLTGSIISLAAGVLI